MLTKNNRKTDYIFVLVLFIGFVFHVSGFFVPNLSIDESFYVTIPLRLINGDSLIQHEWHLTQFSSLFLYLPVYLWLKITGSSDGIMLFLRLLYLAVHTAVSSAVYIYFRKYKGVAIAATMMFFIHIPFTLYAVSYTSVLVLSLLLLSLCLFSIYNKPSKKLYISAGVLYGVSCVCNPAFCIVWLVYILTCVLWTMRNRIAEAVIKVRNKKFLRKSRKNSKKSKSPNDGNVSDFESYSCMFSKEAIIYSVAGIGIVAVISIIFYFSTGGTLSAIAENLPNMFGSSEHITDSAPLTEKLTEIFNAINKVSFKMPYLLPILLTALAADKKRKTINHRLVYLFVALSLGILYGFGILYTNLYKTACLSLPFAVFSLVCYILTENKRKPFFYLMWLPCIIFATIGLFTSNTVLFIVGAVFSVSNVAGVFFAYDLYKEIKTAMSNSKTKAVRSKKLKPVAMSLFIIAFAFQLFAYMLAVQYVQITNTSGLVKVTDGPYAGTLMSGEEHPRYEGYLKDFDLIKEKSGENDPVLFATFSNWAYSYIERPEATYTAWFRGELNSDSLLAYYKENPEKIPKYIYIDSYDFRKVKSEEFMQQNIDAASELFEFKQQKLTNGILLTVTDCKFSTE